MDIYWHWFAEISSYCYHTWIWVSHVCSYFTAGCWYVDCLIITGEDLNRGNPVCLQKVSFCLKADIQCLHTTLLMLLLIITEGPGFSISFTQVSLLSLSLSLSLPVIMGTCHHGYRFLSCIILHVQYIIFESWWLVTVFYFRSGAAPSYGFMILNRLSNENMLEDIAANMEFRVQNPFVLFKKRAGGH